MTLPIFNNGSFVEMFQFSTYQRVMKAFEEDLLEVIGFKEASIIHEAIVNCFGKIENKINRHQSHKVQVHSLHV